MLTFLVANAATILVGLAVLAVVGLIIRTMARNQKAGKSSCGCNCAGCPSCTACHGKRRQ